VTIAKRPFDWSGTREKVPLICPTSQAKCLRHIGTTGKSVRDGKIVSTTISLGRRNDHNDP
jgi:hypothetical protein